MQQYPQIFTLLLALSVLASIVTLLIAAYWAVRGQWKTARTIATRWALGVGIYLLVSITVSFFTPARIIPLGADWCFDDWCLAVTGITKTDAGTASLYTTQIRISNRARRSEAATGFWAYVRDESDRRYAPEPGSWQNAVATKVPAHGSTITSMVFRVPSGARGLGLVTDHGGVRPCGVVESLLEIGQGGCLFHQPNMIRIE